MGLVTTYFARERSCPGPAAQNDLPVGSVSSPRRPARREPVGWQRVDVAVAACRVLKVSRSGTASGRDRPDSVRTVADADLVETIKAVHEGPAARTVRRGCMPN
jgi:hypothetical protein